MPVRPAPGVLKHLRGAESTTSVFECLEMLQITCLRAERDTDAVILRRERTCHCVGPALVACSRRRSNLAAADRLSADIRPNQSACG